MGFCSTQDPGIQLKPRLHSITDIPVAYITLYYKLTMTLLGIARDRLSKVSYFTGDCKINKTIIENKQTHFSSM